MFQLGTRYRPKLYRRVVSQLLVVPEDDIDMVFLIVFEKSTFNRPCHPDARADVVASECNARGPLKGLPIKQEVSLKQT